MKYLRKLNVKGFGHIELLVIIATIAVIGGVGSYVMLRKSHADVSPLSVCGSGYAIVKSAPVTGDGKYNSATLYLLKNSGLMKACAVLVSTGSSYGHTKYMRVQIDIFPTRDSNRIVAAGGMDEGQYKYYAGQVYINYGAYAGLTPGYVVGALPYVGSTTLLNGVGSAI